MDTIRKRVVRSLKTRLRILFFPAQNRVMRANEKRMNGKPEGCGEAATVHRKSVRRPTNDKLDGAGAEADNGKGKDGARATSFKKRYGQTEKSGKIFHSVRAPALGGLRHRHRGVLRRVRRRASHEPRRLPHRRDLAHLRRQRKPVRTTPAHRVQRALRHSTASSPGRTPITAR